MPHVDWTISAGNLIVLFVGLLGIYIKISDRMKAMETKVDAIWGWFMGQLPDIPGGTKSIADNLFLHARKPRRED